jgi:hypothetical protein
MGDSTLIVLGNMNKINLEYTCKVTLLKKKLKIWRFCDEYWLINMVQTQVDSYRMPLVDNVINQLCKSNF